MKELCLQHILLPGIEICTEEGLYFRNISPKENAKMDFINGQVILPEDSKICFATYFNLFSWEKWKHYTDIQNVKLRIKVKGIFEIEIVQDEMVSGRLIQKILCADYVDASKGQKDFVYEIESFSIRGQISFRLKSYSEEGIFYGGEYFTECAREPKLPAIAVNICTFHREEFVYRNFKNIRRYMEENGSKIVRDYYDFYIVDNGQSLDASEICIDHVNVVSQKDSGSTGGFTRGFIEIMAQDRKYDYVIVMDDDILFEPEILERTCMFQAFKKKEYSDSILGGVMMDLRTPWLQNEAGGYFDKYNYYSLKHDYNLNDRITLLLNDYEQNARVNAWWFCCIPGNIITKTNLPYPFFFHRDDMEFGYRNRKTIILMNGIGVWHESFFNKTASWHTYYDIRNLLILDALHFRDFNRKDAKKILWKTMLDRVVKYRYKEADFLIEAYEDFLKGPFWLRKNDNAEYLEQKIQKGYRLGNISKAIDYNWYEYRMNFSESKKRRLVRKLTLNGYLLPANKYVIAPISNYSNFVSFRAKYIINYDFIRQKGFLTYKSYKQAVCCFLQMFKILILLDLKFGRAKKLYMKEFKRDISLKQWKKRLGIK